MAQEFLNNFDIGTFFEETGGITMSETMSVYLDSRFSGNTTYFIADGPFGKIK